ncbi:MAG TPA: opioid growth factor receptor-related protein [Microvirga sp.]|nr:opioid growth factor receptor-related protein [Microvirga sp.]
MTSGQGTNPLHAFLAGRGTDGRGRTLERVLAFSDDELERVHDYIQWLFPLPTRSMAQPDAPVLTGDAIEAIKADSQALANLRRAAERMLRFYEATDGWLTFSDHNHLRITRILKSLRLLAGDNAARAFHARVTARHRAAGAPINPRNLAYWSEALEG